MSENTLGIGAPKRIMQNPPAKWFNVYRNDEEKCVFVGKDGCSGLIRATDKTTGKKFEWRSTDALARESGLSKKRVEEILEHYCNKRVVRQHAKDPEKWGYWELVGTEKEDPDVVAKDHENRMDKQQQGKSASGGNAPKTPAKPDGKGTAPKMPSPPAKVPTPGPFSIPKPGIAPKSPATKPTTGKSPSKPTPRCP